MTLHQYHAAVAAGLGILAIAVVLVGSHQKHPCETNRNCTQAVQYVKAEEAYKPDDMMLKLNNRVAELVRDITKTSDSPNN